MPRGTIHLLSFECDKAIGTHGCPIIFLASAQDRCTSLLSVSHTCSTRSAHQECRHHGIGEVKAVPRRVGQPPGPILIRVVHEDHERYGDSARDVHAPQPVIPQRAAPSDRLVGSAQHCARCRHRFFAETEGRVWYRRSSNTELQYLFIQKAQAPVIQYLLPY